MSNLLVRRRLARPSGYAERETLPLLQREKIIPVDVDNGPDNDNPEEHDEAGTVFHYQGEREHDWYEIDKVVNNEDESFDAPQPVRRRTTQSFPLPDRPPG